MTRQATFARQGLRFSAVGIINSVVGYAIIVLALFLGASDYMANALGYAVGLGIGFLLHRNWVFAAAEMAKRSSGPRYILAFAIAYLANVAVVALARHFGMVDRPATHVAAMACYSLTFFLLARYFVFSSDRTMHPMVAGVSRVPAMLSAVGVALCASVYFAVVLVNPTTHDVVWQLWIGDRLHSGSRLYIDIMEINPPLWFWMAQGVAAIGDLLSLDSRTVLVALIILWSMTAAGLVLRLLKNVPGVDAFAAIIGIVVAAYSFKYFGQREHLALIAAVPYAILIARRRSGETIDASWAILIALAASAGFALKHYFVAIPFLLEIWLAMGLFARRQYIWFRPETVVLGICAIGYAIAAFYLTPEFFSSMVPMVRTAYDSYEVDWYTAIVRPQLIFSAVACILAAAMVRSDHGGGRLEAIRKNVVIALILTTVGFAVSFILQKKGWPYHGLPMVLAAFSALAAALLLRTESFFGRLRSEPLAAALILYLVYSGIVSGGYTNPVRNSVEQMLDAVPAGEPVAALGNDPMIGWPMVAERGHPWGLRHYALWPLRSVIENEARADPDPALAMLGDRIRRDTAIDLACMPPRMIIVDDAAARLELPQGSFDLLGWLSRDPMFEKVFSRYKLVKTGDFGTRAFVTSEALRPLIQNGCPKFRY